MQFQGTIDNSLTSRDQLLDLGLRMLRRVIAGIGLIGIILTGVVLGANHSPDLPGQEQPQSPSKPVGTQIISGNTASLPQGPQIRVPGWRIDQR